MPVYFQKLENALKRANEFIDVGKKTRALEILCDVLRSRKHRQWQKKHEDIMMKYLELCVELRLSFVAKEGIYQYKTICQQTCIKSFEDIVRAYLKMAENEAEAAREKAAAPAIDDIDDLDNLQTPESILLSVVSSEVSQDRTDRVVLLPWIKFLWESYRTCLDILRNNPRVERLYHDIAHQAFQFCIKYNRKTEFRKLCESLHTHLDTLKKNQVQVNTAGTHQSQNFINLNNAESQAMHLETRLVQLDSAIQMELWQEAYRATDDIKKFGLMNLTKKLPKPQLMANYYQKLALVFWKANNPLFHAAALFKLFTLSKELRKNMTQEDVQRMASRVVGATLAVPIPPIRAEIEKLVETEENVIESHQRNLASLLNLTAATPTRSSLINDLKRMGVLQHAYQPLQDLYHTLEVEFHPLTLSQRVDEGLKFIETCETCPELVQYIPSLKEVTIVRLLKEISQVYQRIEYNRVLQLCPFVNRISLEQIVVSAARRNDLQVRIDHRNDCLYFGIESRTSSGEEVIEGPHLQSMPSEQIRQQLVYMYSVLHRAQAMMEPDLIRKQREQTKRQVMITYEANKEIDHRNLLARPDYIEQRKEEIERLSQEREKRERELQEEKQRELRMAEDERLAREAEERARQRQEREDLELRKRMAMDQIEKMRQTEGGLKLLDGINEDDLAKMKIEDIKTRQFKQLEKERTDQLTRLRNLERRIDHLERAKRIEEIPLLKKAYLEWKERDRKEWDESEADRIDFLCRERTQALANRARLMRMQTDTSDFMKKLSDKRHQAYLEQLAEWNKMVEQERAIKLEERKEKRLVERREAYIRSKREAEERKRAEERNKQREIDEKARRRATEMQAQKEREIEERLNKQTLETNVKEPSARRQEIRDKSPVTKADEEDNWRKVSGPPRDVDKRDQEPQRESVREPYRPPASRRPVDDTPSWRTGGSKPNMDRGDRDRDRDHDRGDRGDRGGDRDRNRDQDRNRGDMNYRSNQSMKPREYDRRSNRRDGQDDERDFSNLRKPKVRGDDTAGDSHSQSQSKSYSKERNEWRETNDSDEKKDPPKSRPSRVM